MDKKIRILVSGSSGFLGMCLCKKLIGAGYENIITFRSSEFDLRKEGDVERLFKKKGPFEAVIHLAAIVKGIKFRIENPANVLHDNLIMNVLMQEHSIKNKIKKFIGLGSVTAYPDNAKIPYQEEEYLRGEPDETNYSYAIAKRIMLQQGKACKKQYNFSSVHLIMTNMYGPGYDLNSKELYVIPSMIKKFDDAQSSGKEEVTFWGTGKATREFLYVDDAAEAIILAMEKYDGPEPINIGTGIETSVKEIAEKISQLSGFEGKVLWDATKPEGKLRNVSDISKAKEIGFIAKTPLHEGLKKTIEWYTKEKSSYSERQKSFPKCQGQSP